MSDNFPGFPSDKVEFLTMLHLQQQDISKLSAKELWEKYEQFYKEVYQLEHDRYGEKTHFFGD